MKRLVGLPGGSRLMAPLSILLAFILIFGLFPHQILAQNKQVTADTPLSLQNESKETPAAIEISYLWPIHLQLIPEQLPE
jgi:hypothetical protein